MPTATTTAPSSSPLLHRGEHVARAQQQQLREFLQDLLIEGAKAGDLRDDVVPEELAGYCLNALTAASTLPSEAAVIRLVTLILTGLRPPRDSEVHPDGAG